MENISVSVRVRPLNEQESEKGSAWRVEGNAIQPASKDPGSDASYALDNVFAADWTNQQVYNKTTEDVIKKVVGGFNGTVFAYGQTSSGKTHTMRGTAEEAGIISLAVSAIFDHITETQDREFLLRVSYMEIYNEEVHDLLSSEHNKLQIHENKENGVYVAGLREDIVTSSEHVMQLLNEGERHRHFGETKMNKNSSRSHTLFRMVVESRSRDAEASDGGAVWVSTLTLVDLAGSERIAKTGAEGLRMKEGASINKSLLTLGTVINKLSEGTQVQGGHIPYRDSKLTRILQPSLGGNAKTAIICNITPATIHVDESHSTLRFACRAKRVVNNAVVNEVLSDAAVLKRQAKEIAELRRILETSGGNADVEKQIAALRAELLHKEQENELVQLQLQLEKEERERAQRKVDGLTRLMMEDGRERAKEARVENRRETWCPGAAGAGNRNRKRSLPPKTSPLPEDRPAAEGRQSDPLLLADIENLNLTPSRSPAAKRRSFTDALSPVKAPPSDDLSDAAALKSRIRELEMEQGLMQRELDHMSEMAQRTDSQLRAAEEELMTVADEKDQLVPQLEEARWRSRQVEKELADLKESRASLQKVNSELETEMEALKMQASQQAADASKQTAGLAAEKQLLLEEVQAARQEARLAKDASASLAALKDQLEVELQAVQQDAVADKASLEKKTAELGAAASTIDTLQGKIAEAEARCRELYDSNKRLEEHIADLESRKRAPLYQKKQEDELKAAVEKARECEIRAQEAELHCKEAKAGLAEADDKVAALTTAMEELRKQAEAAAAEAAETLGAQLQASAAEQQGLKACHEEAIATLTAKLAEAEAQSLQHVTRIAAMEADIVSSTAAQAELAATVKCLESASGEAQACADAASERVRFLEEQLESQAAEAEAAAAAAHAVLEQAQANAASQLQAAQDAGIAAVAAKQAELDAALDAARAAAEEAASALQAAQETAAQEATKAAANQAALQQMLSDVNQKRAELEAKVAKAAASLNAADELREARRQHKQDVLKLQQELKASSASSKGGEKETDRLKKELEKAKEKVAAAEAKIRTAVQDKNTAQVEKATLERELKMLKGTTGKLTKDLEKKDALAEKKRETIMVGLNKTKTQLSEMEDSLAALKLELERTQFELHAKKGECEAVKEELQQAQSSGAELMRECDDLRTKVEGLESDLQAANQALEALRSEHACKLEELGSLAEGKRQADAELAALQAKQQEAVQHSDLLEADLEITKESLQASRTACSAAEAQVDTLQGLLREAADKLASLQFSMDEERARAHAKEEEAVALRQGLEQQLASQAALAAQAQAEVAELAGKQEALEAEIKEHVEYQMQIEGQLNDAELKNQTLSSSITDLQTRFAQGNAALDAVRSELEACRAEVLQTRQALAEREKQATATAEQLASTKEELSNLQAALDTKAAELQLAGQQRELSDQDWEARLQQAVDSAEQWKEFAEKLGKEKEGLEAKLAGLQQQLQDSQADAAAIQQQALQQQAQLDAALEAERGQLLREVEQLQAALAGEQEAHAQEGAQRAQQAQELQGQVQQLQAELQAEREGLAASNEAVEAMRVELAAAAHAALAAGQKLREEQERHHAAEQKVHAQAAQLEEVMQAQRQRELEAEHACQAQQSRMAQLQQEVEVLQTRAGTARDQALAALQVQHASSLAEQRARSEAMQSELAGQVAAKQQQLQETRDALAEQAAAHLQVLQASQQAQHSAGQLQAALQAAHAKLAAAEQQQQAGAQAMQADVQKLEAELQLHQEAAQSAEEQVAQLHCQIQQLESRLNQAHVEKEQLRLSASLGVTAGNQEAVARCSLLESELRKSRRREEKLQALQFRLREDLKACGGNMTAFDKLRDVRGLEYELDFVTNRAQRDGAAFKDKIDKLQTELAQLKHGQGSCSLRAQHSLANKENMLGRLCP